jgi:7-cyano-7-deazaguanine reductase
MPGDKIKGGIMAKKTRSSYEGLQENVRKMALPEIDVWENQYSERVYTIKSDTAEFTCICPKTGLPDFASICVEYSPGRWCIELKSFKEYLLAYRTIGIFHEHAVNRMLEDIVRAAKPRAIKITGVFNSRGGITTTVEAEYKE